MLRMDPVVEPSRTPPRRLIVYVEGPQDRAILRAWAYRLLPSMGRRLFGASVILGGRRPARAVAHFHSAGGLGAGLIGLCVLYRDGGSQPPLSDSGVPGLEFFTWGRRHIESYLLVPAAIQRSLRIPGGDRRIRRAIDAALPGSVDEAAYGQIDAKRLLGPNGELPRVVGQSISVQRVARATRAEELHPDVHRLFDRLREGLGISDPRA
ncbi:MAG: hypothetical protein V3T64_04685 [Myxococcota bacterium]